MRLAAKSLATAARGGLARAGLLYQTVCVSGLSRQARTWPQALLAAAVVLSIVLCLDRHLLLLPAPTDADPHAVMALEMAVNRCAFGAVSALVPDCADPQATVRGRLAQGVGVWQQRLLDLPAQVAASPQEYRQALRPAVCEENALVLLDEALLRLAPGLTEGGLARALLAVKVACLAAFVFWLLRAGASPLLAGIAFHLALLLVAELSRTHPLSQYPLLAPVTLLYLAMLGLALGAGVHGSAVKTLPVLAAAGTLAGFLTNLRTSYTPVVLALLLLYLLVAGRDLVRGCGLRVWRAGALAALALLAFAGGWCLFDGACLGPMRRATAAVGCDYAHHPVGHPLVLGLALAPPPHDALALREGIAWKDDRGPELARRIDPAVQYLDRHYDAALLTYYCKLWLYYPGEMWGLYRAKLDTAGVNAFWWLRDRAEADEQAVPATGWALAAWLRWPLQALARGSQWLLVFAGLALLGLLAGRRLGPGTSFAAAGLTVTACLLLLEATATMANFALPYHCLLLLLALLPGLVPYQLALDVAPRLGRAAAGLVRRARSPRNPESAAPGARQRPSRVAA